MTADAAQKAIGVSPAAWRNYFTSHKRDVPSRVLIDLAALFEMPLSRFIALAEAEETRLRGRAESSTDELLEGLRPGARRTVEALRDPFAKPAKDDEHGSNGRAAG